MALYDEDELDEDCEEEEDFDPSSPIQQLDDEELRQALLEVDSSEDVEVSAWEADFIDSVCFKWGGDLSYRERKSAREILVKYHPDYMPF